MMLRRFIFITATLGCITASAATVTALPAPTAAVQQSPDSSATPIMLNVGKQQLAINPEDIATITPTDQICIDGIFIQLKPSMASQLRDFSTQNANQHLVIQWNGITLGDTTISAPLSNSLCFAYVDKPTQQALMNAFGGLTHQPTVTTTQ